MYSIVYEDGDVEDVSIEELKIILCWNIPQKTCSFATYKDVLELARVKGK